MASRPTLIEDALPEPHLLTTSDVLKLPRFLESDKRARESWTTFVRDTKDALRELYGREPSPDLVRRGIAAALGRSDAFRRFVIAQGGVEEARDDESYEQIVLAGAGTILYQCSNHNASGDRGA